MCQLPAHLMRSVAGGYDNESVAVTIICMTFWLWMRTLAVSSSESKSSPLSAAVMGLLTGISYVYMVATWGAYTFVLNMIGVSAVLTAALGRFTPNLHIAYSVFYLVGTFGAIQFPIVGDQPYKNMEQLGPMAVFGIYQVLLVAGIFKTQSGLNEAQYRTFLYGAFAASTLAVALVIALVLPSGWIGPMSSRIRSLFIPHTHTGNPLVDSVAEHQATPPSMYSLCFV